MHTISMKVSVSKLMLHTWKSHDPLTLHGPACRSCEVIDTMYFLPATDHILCGSCDLVDDVLPVLALEL